MKLELKFDRKVLAEGLAVIIEDEKNNPSDIDRKLRKYISDGKEDMVIRWALDTLEDTIQKSVEIC